MHIETGENLGNIGSLVKTSGDEETLQQQVDFLSGEHSEEQGTDTQEDIERYSEVASKVAGLLELEFGPDRTLWAKVIDFLGLQV